MPFEFPFEQAAMSGVIPEGLSLVDYAACSRLAKIYIDWRQGKDRGVAKAKKETLRRQWESESRLLERHAAMYKETERLKAEIRKEENIVRRARLALELVDTLDGLKRNGGNEHEQEKHS